MKVCLKCSLYLAMAAGKMGGLRKNPVRFNAWALTCLLTIFDGPKLLKKIVKYLQPTLADNL